MFSSLLNISRDIWNHFNDSSPTKTDDEILQECVDAYEKDLNSVTHDDPDSMNIHNICTKCTGKLFKPDTYHFIISLHPLFFNPNQEKSPN